MIDTKNNTLQNRWRILFFILSLAALLIVINQIFNLNLFGHVFMDTTYYFILLTIYLSLVFIIYPFKKNKPPAWYDILLFLLSGASSFYMALHGDVIFVKAWSILAPPGPTAAAVILWLLVIEGVRRTTGHLMAGICLLFSLYPLFAHYMPGFMEGHHFSFLGAARYHVMSTDSLLGLPMKVVGKILIGFMVFGVALQTTGGGKFFLSLALSLLGHVRGGPAKVSIISSALFGSMSGSVLSNVVTTGSMTIPTMKKTGYEPHYAGAIEACASTGGVLMPPVMGAAAFLIASFVNIPYLSVCIAAAVPSFLYYLGLFVQVDAYAARKELKGIDRKDLPRLGPTMAEGWFYLFAVIGLIVLLALFRLEAQAPFFVIVFLFFCSMIRKKTRLKVTDFIQFIESSGRLLVELLPIMAGAGLIIGSLAMTGVAHAFSRELVVLAGDNVVLLLFLGALTSFILGMGMSITACYVFLAVVLAPALVTKGFFPLSAHLFILYWGMISYISPPIAFGAYAAAGIAQASPLKTGFQSMRLGVVIFIIPFFFVINPAMILHGSVPEIIYSILTCAIGVIMFGGALEGFLFGLGKLTYVYRALFFIAGLLLAFPGWKTDLAGLILFFCGFPSYRLIRNKTPASLNRSS